MRREAESFHSHFQLLGVSARRPLTNIAAVGEGYEWTQICSG